MFTSLNAYAKKDCSQIKKLSKDYLACKASNLKSSTTGLGLDTSNIKEKKTLIQKLLKDLDSFLEE